MCVITLSVIAVAKCVCIFPHGDWDCDTTGFGMSVLVTEYVGAARRFIISPWTRLLLDSQWL